ncbi:hypothetical protein [uncultured Phenylobacterium sp.]|uniref:hypothetical protein n=1 Tax=uncultured Phenylobacterium sp. TaxID=349273 RepID=UPI0025D247F8|nr:hypothetical protein [uncultured Phenylobacterium sp.]
MISVLVIRHFSIETFPRVLGLLSPFLIPASLGSVFAGVVRDTTGNYDLLYVVIAAALLPGLLAMWKLAPRAVAPRPGRAATLPAPT